MNSTPSADRYAALKDLDEQIRENKEKEKLESSVFNQPNPGELNLLNFFIENYFINLNY